MNIGRSNKMSMHNLPKDIVVIIANDSYRTWQLLRLTCCAHYTTLGCYHSHNNIIFYGPDIKNYPTFIKYIFDDVSGAGAAAMLLNTSKIPLAAYNPCSTYHGFYMVIRGRRGQKICEIMDGSSLFQYQHDVHIKICGRIRGRMLTLHSAISTDYSMNYINDHLLLH